jgi:hypothetical protein
VDVLSVAHAKVAKVGIERLSAFASFHRGRALNWTLHDGRRYSCRVLLCLTEVQEEVISVLNDMLTML